ncbi:GYF domain-containing protein [Mariniblastus sp.]|nr:GYF domain-containing protein [Mariniblastus sp.]MDA7926341.1 GYF domain-containing protein [Mariniblastus sp.]
MSDETYYVKIRGRVLGPFHTDRLIEMVSQGKLSRVHMLSTDNQNWQKASEYPDLFQSAGRTTSSPMKPETQNAPTAPGLDSGDVWHYGINGQPQGPVSKSVIMSLFTSGQLTASDSLWREGMDDWLPLSSVPEFSNALQAPQNVQVPQPTANPFAAPGNKFCSHCGSPYQVNQAVCLKCGMSLEPPTPVAGNNYGNNAPVVVVDSSNALSLAQVSFWCGLVGLICFGILLGPIALITGIIALAQGTEKVGYAVAGMILGVVDCGTFFVLLSLL